MGNVIYLEVKMKRRKQRGLDAIDISVKNDVNKLERVLKYLAGIVGYETAVEFLQKKRSKILFGDYKAH